VKPLAHYTTEALAEAAVLAVVVSLGVAIAVMRDGAAAGLLSFAVCAALIVGLTALWGLRRHPLEDAAPAGPDAVVEAGRATATRATFRTLVFGAFLLGASFAGEAVLDDHGSLFSVEAAMAAGLAFEGLRTLQQVRAYEREAGVRLLVVPSSSWSMLRGRQNTTFFKSG
jgi:hypothetical protein